VLKNVRELTTVAPHAEEIQCRWRYSDIACKLAWMVQCAWRGRPGDQTNQVLIDIYEMVDGWLSSEALMQTKDAPSI